MAGFELISSNQLASDASTVTFSSIPSTYQHLKLIFTAALTSGGAWAKVRLNNTSASGYGYQFMKHQTATMAFTTASADSYIKAIELDDDTRYPSSGTMYLMDYADTGEYTAVLTQAASAKRWSYSEGEYRYTSAINRLDLIPNTGSFRTGSTFSLYGMGN